MVTGGDLQFMQDAASGGMLEVELGRMATEKAASAEVKKFGQRMMDDHSKAGQELAQLAGQKKVMLPQEKSPAQKEMMDRLSKLNGAAFDRAYVADMFEDHEKDVTAFEAVAKTATDKDVKDFTAKTLPTLKEHLEMIRGIAGKMNIKPKS